jgi:hypothetical protein
MPFLLRLGRHRPADRSVKFFLGGWQCQIGSETGIAISAVLVADYLGMRELLLCDTASACRRSVRRDGKVTGIRSPRGVNRNGTAQGGVAQSIGLPLWVFDT